jgi:hypothetical protein
MTHITYSSHACLLVWFMTEGNIIAYCFTICDLHQILLVQKVDEMSKEYSTHVEKCVQNFSRKNGR